MKNGKKYNINYPREALITEKEIGHIIDDYIKNPNSRYRLSPKLLIKP